MKKRIQILAFLIIVALLLQGFYPISSAAAEGEAAGAENDTTVIEEGDATKEGESLTIIEEGGSSEVKEDPAVIEEGGSAEVEEEPTVIDEEEETKEEEDPTVIEGDDSAEVKEEPANVKEEDRKEVEKETISIEEKKDAIQDTSVKEKKEIKDIKLEKTQTAESTENELNVINNEDLSTVSNLSLTYDVYLGNTGWTGYKAEGKIAGSTSKTNTTNRMESISVKLNNSSGISGGIKYRTHITAGLWIDGNYVLGTDTGGGWSAYVTSEMQSGVPGSNKHLEAISLELTGNLSNYYFIDYDVFTMQSPSNVTPVAPSSLCYDWTGVVDSKFLSNNPNWDPGPFGTTKNFAGTFMYTLPITAFRASIIPRSIKYVIDADGGLWKGQDLAYGYMDSKATKVIADPVREGYTFDGWTIEHSNTDETLNYYQNPSKHINGTFDNTTNTYTAANKDVWFTAKWKKNTLTIKYNANGGTVGAEPSADIASYKNNWTYTTADRDLANFSSFLISRTGYQRYDGKEWNTKADGTGKSFDQDIDYSMIDYASNLTTGSRTVTMYAQWLPNTYTIKANLNGGSGSFGNITATYDKAFTLWGSIPKKTGYVFKGWSCSINSNTYNPSDLLKNLTTKNNDIITMTAKWELLKYEIVFHANGGTGTMSNMTFTYNEQKNLEANTFERANYEFVSWNTKADGTGKTYTDKQLVKNIGTTNDEKINLYAQWTKKLFNVAYSGNNQSAGTNMLEYNIWLGNNYTFRPNVFEKTEKQIRKTADGIEYEVEQKYSFQKWSMVSKFINKEQAYANNQILQAFRFYNEANDFSALSDKISDSKPYEEVKPLNVTPSEVETPAMEYINLNAVWNAFPLIIVEPKPDPDPDPDHPQDPDSPEEPDKDDSPRIENNILYFYEGEEPTKQDLIAHLTVTDAEDGDLLNKIKIKKIVYNDGNFKDDSGQRKKGSTKEWEDDIPSDYIFDTYYLEMEKDEIITHKVTYEIVDSVGNITTAELPVMVKYNNFPEIEATEVYYYFKEEANKGLITDEKLLKNAKASDVEDKNSIKDKLEVIEFDSDAVKMQSQSEAEFLVKYKVTDRFKKTTYKEAKIIIADPDAIQSEIPITYVRYISGKYLDTLEPTSKWKEADNYSYLTNALSNESASETWYFTHEEVKEVKDWIIGDGNGNWKKGQAANQEFYNKFSGCKQ